MSDKTAVGIDEIREVEFIPIGIADAAYQIDGIEMRRLFKNSPLMRRIKINLRAFDNLERFPSGRIPNPERPATRFALVPDHSAHAQRTVQGVDQGFNLIRRRVFFKIGRKTNVESFPDKVSYFAYLRISRIGRS